MTPSIRRLHFTTLLTACVLAVSCLHAAGDRIPARPRWEYRVLTLERLEKLVDRAAEGKKLKERLTREKAGDQERLARLLEFAINQLGEDGWELVSVNLVGQSGEALLFFKRPR